MKKPLQPCWRFLAVALLGCVSAQAADLDAILALSKPVPKTIDDLRLIEREATKIADKVIPCSVGVQVGPNHGSGVVISKDGLILTAAHVASQPGRNATIRFPDGTTVRAKTLGMNMEADGALIQINDEREWPFAPLVTLDDYPKPGDWCIATGHPGGFDPERSPPVRFGRIIDVNKYILRTDCPINSGDSGGPLFDLEGRVIGIHSRIAEQATVNLHGPVLEFLESWEQMKAGEIYPAVPSSRFLERLDVDDDGKVTRAEQPEGPHRRTFDRLAEKYGLDKDEAHSISDLKKKLGWRDVRARLEIRPYEVNSRSGGSLARERFVRGKQVRRAFEELAERVNKSVVEVRLNGKRVSLGTVVKEGIVTKASQLTDGVTCKIHDGRELKVNIVGVDKEHDLALLRVDAELPPVKWADAADVHLGNWLVTPGLDKGAISVGVISVSPRKIKGMHGFLGIAIDNHDMGVLVTEVIGDSGAAKAGLQADDVVVSVFKTEVRTREELQAQVFQHRPGEIVRITVMRDGANKKFAVRLGAREDLFPNDERFGSGRLNGELSIRRGDFPEAVQHDSVLKPTDCGGPVLNVQGEAIGINIARADRVASYALPSHVVQEVAQRLASKDTDESETSENP
jgi:serine protease Do